MDIVNNQLCSDIYRMGLQEKMQPFIDNQILLSIVSNNKRIHITQMRFNFNMTINQLKKYFKKEMAIEVDDIIVPIDNDVSWKNITEENKPKLFAILDNNLTLIEIYNLYNNMASYIIKCK